LSRSMSSPKSARWALEIKRGAPFLKSSFRDTNSIEWSIIFASVLVYRVAEIFIDFAFWKAEEQRHSTFMRTKQMPLKSG
jgi:hypothetical protein